MKNIALLSGYSNSRFLQNTLIRLIIIGTKALFVHLLNKDEKSWGFLAVGYRAIFASLRLHF